VPPPAMPPTVFVQISCELLICGRTAGDVMAVMHADLTMCGVHMLAGLI